MKDLINQYKIKKTRLLDWDYSKPGVYFITFEAYNHIHYFGEIIDNKMITNKIGEIATTEFFKTFIMRPTWQWGAFCIMPNHLHAIIIINEQNIPPDINIVCQHCNEVKKKKSCPITGIELQTIPGTNNSKKKNQLFRQPRSISSFAAGYKAAVINHLNTAIDIDTEKDLSKFNKKRPLWQSNFRDHIIRNQYEYDEIEQYILKNELNWCDDCFNRAMKEEME